MRSHISILFLELYTKKDGYKKVKELLQEENTVLLQSAVEILSFIELSSLQAKETYTLFRELMKTHNSSLDKTILISSNKIKDKHKVFEKILELYALNENLEIKYSLSKILLFNKTKDLNKRWFQACLFSLVNIKNYDKDLLRNIGFILNNILEEKEEYKIIIEYFKQGIKECQLQDHFPTKEFSFFIKNFSLNHKSTFDKFIQELNSSNEKEVKKLASYFTLN